VQRNGLAPALVVVGLLASLVTASGDADAKGKKQAKRRPSTPAERTAAANAARALEIDPIGPEADARRKVALVVLEAPDIQVQLCANVLVSFANESSPRHIVFLQQMLFSTMAFMSEQPERASDVQDRMLDLQKRGALETYYRKETAPCVGADLHER
jgi:hypothetical protein